jgi:hypothetical protein
VPDVEFGGDGFVNSAFGTRSGDAAYDGILLGDNQWIGVGFSSNWHEAYFAIAKYNLTTQQLDDTFGDNGRVLLFPPSNGQIGYCKIGKNTGRRQNRCRG